MAWEANNEIPRKQMLLVKRSVSEQGNQHARLLFPKPMAVMHPKFTLEGADIAMQSSGG
jgi:hypothetical protein